MIEEPKTRHSQSLYDYSACKLPLKAFFCQESKHVVAPFRLLKNNLGPVYSRQVSKGESDNFRFRIGQLIALILGGRKVEHFRRLKHCRNSPRLALRNLCRRLLYRGLSLGKLLSSFRYPKGSKLYLLRMC